MSLASEISIPAGTLPPIDVFTVHLWRSGVLSAPPGPMISFEFSDHDEADAAVTSAKCVQSIVSAAGVSVEFGSVVTVSFFNIQSLWSFLRMLSLQSHDQARARRTVERCLTKLCLRWV